MTNKKFGFTLAEVLITLAIIGVVAALTLPTLLSNYEKKEWVTRIIKAHAEFTSAARLLLANKNDSLLSNTDMWTKLVNGNCTEVNLGSDKCAEFINEFVELFPGSYVVKMRDINYLSYKYLDGTTDYNIGAYGIKMKNGILLTYPRFFYVQPNLENTETAQVANIRVDVNGEKGPNIIGRDIFTINVKNNGTTPIPCSKESSNGVATEYWATAEGSACSCNPKIAGVGWGCIARVMEKGKMDY